MNWDPVAYLKALHTKQLMQVRDAIYRINGGLHQEYWDRYGDEEKMRPYDVIDVRGGNSGCVVTMVQVKAELATREHVPNKKEAKGLRKLRAHMNRNPGR